MISHDPTPVEITERAATIQAGWTRAEKRRRYAMRSDQWTVPEVCEALEDGTRRT